MLYLYLWYKEHSLTLPCLSFHPLPYLACFLPPAPDTWPVPLLPLPVPGLSPSSRSRYLASLLPPAPGTWPVSLLRGWGCCYFENLTSKPFGSAGWQVIGP